jgi:hypothetical protein
MNTVDQLLSNRALARTHEQELLLALSGALALRSGSGISKALADLEPHCFCGPDLQLSPVRRFRPRRALRS